MAIKDPEQLWKTALAQIEIKLDSPAQYKTFFQGTKLIKVNEEKATIGVANAYMSDWLQQKYSDLIQSTVSHVYGTEIKVEFTVESNFEAGQLPQLTKQELLSTKSHPTQQPTGYDDGLFSMQGGVHASVVDAITRAGLNDKYTIKNYIVGPSNQIAHAAAQAVIQNPGLTYNPLFLHGRTGVGKTHLAQGVARSILEQSPNRKVKYVASEGFLNDMVKSLRTNKQFEFRNRYRGVDVLIIDDIQLISKWVSTQDEFFNTFNVLYNNNAQVILVSDRRPEAIKDLQDRLRSRFKGGIVVEIQQPDLETRMAILDHKNRIYGYEIDTKTLEVIARGVEDNIRELEGALQKVALFNQIKPDGELSTEEVKRIIGSDSQSKREKVKVSTVIRFVSKSFGVSVKDIKGKRRTKEVALARQVAMYILREELDYNLEEVAKFVNRNDHTTVIHAVDKIKSMIMTDDGFKEQVVGVIKDMNEAEE